VVKTGKVKTLANRNIQGSSKRVIHRTVDGQGKQQTIRKPGKQSKIAELMDTPVRDWDRLHELFRLLLKS